MTHAAHRKHAAHKKHKKFRRNEQKRQDCTFSPQTQVPQTHGNFHCSCVAFRHDRHFPCQKNSNSQLVHSLIRHIIEECFPWSSIDSPSVRRLVRLVKFRRIWQRGSAAARMWTWQRKCKCEEVRATKEDECATSTSLCATPRDACQQIPGQWHLLPTTFRRSSVLSLSEEFLPPRSCDKPQRHLR